MNNINYFVVVGTCKKQEGGGGRNIDRVALEESAAAYSCWGSHKLYTVLATYTARQEADTCGIWCRAIFQVRIQLMMGERV
jgi:hypothetical protein